MIFQVAKIPWRLKMLAKLALSRLPVSVAAWRRVGLFRHGRMDQIGYAYATFCRHYHRLPNERKHDFVMLELGPGDSLLSALFARALGAERSVLIDVGPFAIRDVDIYRAAAGFLAEELDLNAPRLHGCDRLEDVLSVCQAEYRTGGLESLKQIESQSIDFVWSQAVLEHVRKDEFQQMLVEMRRVLRPNGICSHRVDLRDHLGGKLNNLRFRDQVWESRLFSNSGFYTNRIRYMEMLDLFEQADFSCDIVKIDRWDTLPTPRKRLAPPFRGLANDCLLVRGFDVILKLKQGMASTAA